MASSSFRLLVNNYVPLPCSYSTRRESIRSLRGLLVKTLKNPTWSRLLQDKPLWEKKHAWSVPKPRSEMLSGTLSNARNTWLCSQVERVSAVSSKTGSSTLRLKLMHPANNPLPIYNSIHIEVTLVTRGNKTECTVYVWDWMSLNETVSSSLQDQLFKG